MFAIWMKFASNTPLNFPTKFPRSFDLVSPDPEVRYPNATVKGMDIHEIELYPRKTMKPVFIIQGRVTESAFNDSSVLSKTNDEGDFFQPRHYSIHMTNHAAGKGLQSSCDQISKAIITSKSAATIADLLNKETLQQEDIKHSFVCNDAVNMKTDVGRCRNNPHRSNPQHSHVPQSTIPIQSGQVYAPVVL